jgi:uroporphyrinogen III methyltransferase/synthase
MLFVLPPHKPFFRISHCAQAQSLIKSPRMTAKGTVYFIGAGPGDPGLLTIRGAELLRRSDVVIYDGLVNPAILDLAAHTAEIIYGGRRDIPQGQAVPVKELVKQITAKSRQGKSIVRLRSGDPFIFGETDEEVLALTKANIPFEMVPGVSSVEAAPIYAGIPLTSSESGPLYVVIDAHAAFKPGGHPIDWEHLAPLDGTLVFLMGLDYLTQIVQELTTHGKAPKTPAALVQQGTLATQKTIQGTLKTLVAQADKAELESPVILVVGNSVLLREKLQWFERRPLFGQRIVVTRAREQASLLSQPLRERGADVLEIPAIKIVAPKKTDPIKDAIQSLNSYDWLVFTSPNGVAEFFKLFFAIHKDLRDIGGVRIAAVGPATAQKVKDCRLQVDAMPLEFISKNIIEAIAQVQSIENLRILLLRAEVAGSELPRLLEDMGAIVDDVACYQTVAEKDDARGASVRLLEGGADWITFTSGSTVEHFHARFDLPKLMNRFPSIKLASIGPETTKALTALNLKADFEAAPHTVESLIAGISTPRHTS